VISASQFDEHQCVKELDKILHNREMARNLFVGIPSSLSHDILTKEEEALFLRMQELRSPQFIEPLIRALQKSHLASWRGRVSQALTAIGEPVVPALISALSGPNADDAAFILSDIGDPRGLKPVIDQAIEGNVLLHHAIHLAGKVGGPQAEEFLRLVLIANKPFRFPRSLLHRDAQSWRRMITSEATTALDKISRRSQ